MENDEVVRIPGGAENMPRAGTLLVAFLLVNAIFRLCFLGLNQGEYSDGVLQITQFERTDSFWPPLYTALVWVLRNALGMDGIPAGRLISWAASVALVVPLWRLAERWAGRRAALFTLALYTVSPLAMRWSPRVMTDMLFVCLFHAACERGLLLWSARKSACSISSAGIVWFTFLAVLATLTRYQGLMLLPLGGLAVWALVAAKGKARGMVLAAQLFWLALPAWLLFQRFGHVQQVMDRASNYGLGKTLLNYWNLCEMFLYITPYLLTLPVFVFFMMGLIAGPFCKGSDAESLPLRWLFLYTALAVLAAQSAFQSFQTRYLLPLLPLALTCAGMGMARAERGLGQMGRAGRGLFLALAGVTLIWSLGFGLASSTLQRGAFGDIYDAGRYLRSRVDIAPETPVYTNESYGGKEGMDGINLSFASGRKARLIPEVPYFFTSQPVPPETPSMEPGSILAIHSRNSLGRAHYMQFTAFMGQRYELAPLREAPFTSTLVPLLPDIMGEPGAEQNPLGWVFRYQRQWFETQLYRVGERR